MGTFQDIAQKSGLRLVRSLGKKENTLWLAETAEGEQRILRRYAGTDVPCRALIESDAPQLARVYACYDAGGDTISEEEYIDGTLLSDILRRVLLSEAQAAAVARELCLGLQTLHSLSFVHRDVKPENVMLTQQGRVVLLDLDAAAPVLGTPDTNTRLLGTAGYAAPEQFGFARCDVRADIFALGVLLNVALTGEHPSVRLAKGRLGRIVRRCTNTNAAQRYANVDALLRQLPPARPVHLCGLCGAAPRQKGLRLRLPRLRRLRQGLPVRRPFHPRRRRPCGGKPVYRLRRLRQGLPAPADRHGPRQQPCRGAMLQP